MSMSYPALEKLASEPRHVVAICGSAVSGSEAAAICAARGIAAIVLEQNARPYGKIEDGLPRWHAKLRAKEYQAIDANLQRLLASAHEVARADACALAASALRRPKLPPHKLRVIADALANRWQATGYGGDYLNWITRLRTARCEA